MAQAVEFTSQVASALDAAHGSGVVHGTVSPASMLLDAESSLLVQTGRSSHVLRAGRGYRLGRDPRSDIEVNDVTVSWAHATLRAEGGVWLFVDTGSTNGSFVGSQRVARVPIRGGCEIRLSHPSDGPVVSCRPDYLFRLDHVYLSDFGLDRGPLPDGVQAASGAPGAGLDYAAPEQITGELVAEPADEYGLACSAFELLTGSPPFRGDAAAAVRFARTGGPPPRPTGRRPDLPVAADAVFARALARLPADRYRSCGRFAQALREAFGLPPQMPAPAATASQRYPAAPPAGATAAPAGAAMPPAAWPPDLASAGSAPRPAVDEDVRFTVYRPQVIVQGQWASLLVFAHKTDPVAEPGREPVDPVEQVEARARAHFGGTAPRPVGEDARQCLTRGVRLRIVPDLAGLRCNPPAAEVDWWEPVHEVLFRLLAGPELAGTAVRGAVRVWCGPLIIGEVSIRVQVAAAGPAAQPPLAAESARRYRRIFPSYSHQDRAVVASFAEAARALGDQYLQDVLTLRSGERWDSRLLQLIEDADVFQLFWSRKSMHSPHCRNEWEHALALQRPLFVRPLYWEEPLPEDPGAGLPPPALLALHFVKVPIAATGPPSPVLAQAEATPPGQPGAQPYPQATSPATTAGRGPASAPTAPPAMTAAPAHRRTGRRIVFLILALIIVLTVVVILVLQGAGQ